MWLFKSEVISRYCTVFKLHSISKDNRFPYSSLPILSTRWPLIFLVKKVRRLYKNNHYFCQIYLLSYFKEASLQFHKLQLHRKLQLLHQKGCSFSFATEFSCCKGVIFLCVGQYWNLLFLSVRAAARSWLNRLIAFCLLRNKRFYIKCQKFIFVFYFNFLKPIDNWCCIIPLCSCNLFRNSLLMFMRITLLILPILTQIFNIAVGAYDGAKVWNHRFVSFK